MATRANIAIKNSDGTYDCIYTHWDGADHLPILKTHHNSEEAARNLVELGSLSVLDKNLKPNPHSYHGFDGWANKEVTEDTHTLSGRQLGVCLFHGRDRDDYTIPTERGISFKECFQNSFVYVWSGKRWTKYKV